MAILRSSLLLKGIFLASPLPRLGLRVPAGTAFGRVGYVRIGFRCAASESGGGTGQKVPARLSKMRQILEDAEERALSAGSEPIPKITLDHVSNAYWLSERVRERILQMEKNRINKDGEIVISSTKTRTQKGNIEDALEKLQAIIDAASYVPPPPSEEQKKRIAKLAASSEKKRIENKKALSQKKAIRRSRESWD